MPALSATAAARYGSKCSSTTARWKPISAGIYTDPSGRLDRTLAYFLTVAVADGRTAIDMSEALISVAIALFGVTALTRKRWLLVVAIGFAGTGTLFGLAGFVGLNLHPDWLARLLS